MKKSAMLVKVRINGEGAKALLNSPEVAADLKRRATRVQSALPTDKGEEWSVTELRGYDRVSYIVRAENLEARRTAAADLALQKAIGAGGDG